MAECGSCRLCCKLFEITELAKPACQWCDHAKGVHKGCAIYADRPTSCREFQCLWLALSNQGKPIPDAMRPDRSKVVLTIGGRDHSDLVVHVDPGYPGIWRENVWLIGLINKVLEAGGETIIITGEKRTLLSSAQNQEEFLARHPMLRDK